jgi:hypothetical protein
MMTSELRIIYSKNFIFPVYHMLRLTSMTFRTPSGTPISASATQVVPRMLLGLSGWSASFLRRATWRFPRKVLRLEMRNLVGE